VLTRIDLNPQRRAFEFADPCIDSENTRATLWFKRGIQLINLKRIGVLEMEPKQMFKQMLDFNKTAIDSTFKTMIMFQEQTEAVGNMFMEKNPLLPEEGKKAVQEWISTYKKSRDDFKVAVDEGLKKMESFVTDAGKSFSE
jgi:hypothetical protein